MSSGSANGIGVPLSAALMDDDHAPADEAVETVHIVRAKTDSSRPNSQARSSDGDRIPALSSIDVQEAVLLVTVVQVEECPVLSSSSAVQGAHLEESSLVLEQQPPPHSDEDAQQEEDHTDDPCAIACASTDLATEARSSLSNAEAATTTLVHDSRPGIIFASAIKPKHPIPWLVFTFVLETEVSTFHVLPTTVSFVIATLWSETASLQSTIRAALMPKRPRQW
jgi:hypothetical protein